MSSTAIPITTGTTTNEIIRAIKEQSPNIKIIVFSLLKTYSGSEYPKVSAIIDKEDKMKKKEKIKETAKNTTKKKTGKTQGKKILSDFQP